MKLNMVNFRYTGRMQNNSTYTLTWSNHWLRMFLLATIALYLRKCLSAVLFMSGFILIFITFPALLSTHSYTYHRFWVGFSYGQTSTGKTFTMEGEQINSAYEHAWNEDSSIGIVPRALQHIFTELESQVLSVNRKFVISIDFIHGILTEVLSL